MSAATDAETAGYFARAVEDNVARQLGLRITDARRRAAARMGVSPGTLENLRKGRKKIVPHSVMERIRSVFIAVLNEEIARLEQDIVRARHVGLGHRCHDLAAAEAQLLAAKTLLEKRDEESGVGTCRSKASTR